MEIIIPNNFTKEFLEQSIYRINENTGRVKKCFDQVDEKDIWEFPNGNTNSIGNLVLHLCGNIRQYIISALGSKEDTRERDKEFLKNIVMAKEALLNKLIETTSEATAIIKDLDEIKLEKIYSVQGFNLSGIGIIIHVTEHYSYHTGQIAFWTKQLKNHDLGFYANIDLNMKNKKGN
jgi:uncharacterized damage-inducible protein DinB